MIAQVWTIKGQQGGMTDEMRDFGQKSIDEAVTQDGVEANVILFDPASGDELAIIFFRDQASLDAFQEFSREKIAESESHAGGDDLEIVGSHVYPEVLAAQSDS